MTPGRAGNGATMVVMVPGSVTATATATRLKPCCSLYHRAVELIGKRWTGAILMVLIEEGPLRFSEIKQAVPELSDRLLSERMKELEVEDMVERHVIDDTPVRVEYALTDKGRALEPAVHALKSWAHDWL
jgi:DNA-binding HxlR family transcriptional regulator